MILNKSGYLIAGTSCPMEVLFRWSRYNLGPVLRKCMLGDVCGGSNDPDELWRGRGLSHGGQVEERGLLKIHQTSYN